MIQIFPKEIAEFSHEQLVVRHSISHKIIYLTTLGFLLAALATLPFIYVQVQVSSGGIIRPTIENMELKAPVTGFVKSLQIIKNQEVQQGTRLLTIEAPALAEQLITVDREIEDTERYIQDLQRLIQQVELSAFTIVDSLFTSTYQKSYQLFREQVFDYNSQYLAAKRKYDRTNTLYKNGVVAKADHEEVYFALKKATASFKTMTHNQLSQWQLKLQQYQESSHQLNARKESLLIQVAEGIVKSPINGSINAVGQIYENSFVTANQLLAEISPDTSLTAQCFISPQDVGHIYEGMPVKIRIDAFNYNEWGVVNGTVQEVSKDMQIINNMPVFIIICSLEQSNLELKSGIKGTIKKGLTCQVDFLLNERSLFQLLYDKADNWLNPSL